MRRRRRLIRPDSMSQFSRAECGFITGFVFIHDPGKYVAHHIGSATYGTYSLALKEGRCPRRSSPLATPANTCGTCASIQATGQDLEYLTPQVAASFE